MPNTSKKCCRIIKNKNASLRIRGKEYSNTTERIVEIAEVANDALKDINISVSDGEDKCDTNLKVRMRNRRGDLSGINFPNTNCATNCGRISTVTEKDVLDSKEMKYSDFRNSSQTSQSVTKEHSRKCEKDETRTQNQPHVPTENVLKEKVGLNRDCSEEAIYSEGNKVKHNIPNSLGEKKLYRDDLRPLKFLAEYFKPMYPD